MNYCFVLQSRFWIYTMLFGFYMDMYILTLLASRFLRSKIRMSFKNYSCTCSCCFWRSSLCTYTFWLKYIRHSYVAASSFFFPTHPLLRVSSSWLAGFTCLALGRLCPPFPQWKIPWDFAIPGDNISPGVVR